MRRIRDKSELSGPAQVALKSSGDTLSRNSLNFSTSSSRTARGLLVVLVGNQQTGLGQHRLLDVDRDADPQGDGHRVRRAGRHLDVAVEDQVGVEGALLQVDDPDLLERMAKRGNQISDQIVGQRPAGSTPCCSSAIAVASGWPIQIGR